MLIATATAVVFEVFLFYFTFIAILHYFIPYLFLCYVKAAVVTK